MLPFNEFAIYSSPVDNYKNVVIKGNVLSSVKEPEVRAQGRDERLLKCL